MADTIDINVFKDIEEVTINATPNVIQVNINKVVSIGAVTSVNGQTGDIIIPATDNNFTTVEKNKLAGIASGATVNDTDANLKNRANHTGTQLASTISDFATTVANLITNKVDKVTGKSLIADTEILRLASVTNYDNSSNVTALSNKVDKVTGKGLSTNDYTTAEQTKVANLSGVNTGDNATNSQYSGLASSKQDTLTPSNTHTFVDTLASLSTPVDSDRMIIVDNSVSLAKKITWANIKATLKTYFDTIYTTTSAVSTQITTALSGYATQTYVNSRGFVTNVVTALGYTPVNKAGDDFTGTINVTTLITDANAIEGYSETGDGINGQGGAAGVFGLSTNGYGGKFQSINEVAGYFKNSVGNNSNIAEFEGDDALQAYITHDGKINAYNFVKSGGLANEMLMADGSVINLLKTFNGQSGTVYATATKGTVVYEFTSAGSLVLPTAVDNTCIFKVKNRHSANITVTFTSGQNADGATTITLTPYQALDFISNNSNYNIF